MLEINKIYNIDCYEGIKLLEDNSIDFLLTDPPFLISRKTNFHTMKGHRGTSMDFGDWG